MEKIAGIITDLVYKDYDKIRIALELLKRGYPTNEIKHAFENSKIGKKNVNKIIGILLIVVGVLANLYTKSVYLNNNFRFDFFSQADFMLFNERILKPTITLSMIFLGINLLTNRANVSQTVKVFLIILLGVFTLTITSYYSYLAFIFGSLSLLLVSIIELPQKIKNPEIVKIFPYFNKVWKGTAGYIFLLLGVVLVYSSEIRLNYVKAGETTFKASLGFIDYFLIYIKPIFGWFGLVTSLLISINFSKYKISLSILSAISIIILIACFLHSSFQTMIHGCSIILITAVVIYLKNRKNLNIQTVN